MPKSQQDWIQSKRLMIWGAAGEAVLKKAHKNPGQHGRKKD
jgi:hypothetical protein